MISVMLNLSAVALLLWGIFELRREQKRPLTLAEYREVLIRKNIGVEKFNPKRRLPGKPRR